MTIYPSMTIIGRPQCAGESSLCSSNRVSSAFFVTWLGAGSFASSFDDAMAAANGLIDAAEATGNPYVLSWALLAYGLAVYDADPVRSLAALRRGLMIAQDSGNRAEQSHLATNLCRFGAEHGDPLAAFDYFTVAIGNYHDSGNTYMIRGPRGFLPRFSTGSDGTSRRPPSPGSPSQALSLHSPSSQRSAPRLLTSAMWLARRPTNRSLARARR
jgi:hypothetical protein